MVANLKVTVEGEMADSRLEQFKADISEMRIKDPAVSRDTMLLRLGAILLVVGVAITVVAFFLSHTTNSTLDQNDDHIVALLGVAVTIVGAALFLRYSLGAFLRFWLARLIYEQRAQTDRLLAGRQGSDSSRV